MSRFAADLHMHSCVSPCADLEMTPNNVANMSFIKGLDIFAVSDHNTAKNLPAIKAVADARGLLLIPAMELETSEEVHLLCYLPTVEAALALSDEVYAHLPDIPNTVDFFGAQTVMNDDDEPVEELSKLLIQATDIPLEDAAALCRSYGGVPVPAHINRSSNSLLSSLGFMPEEPHFSTVEVYRGLPVPAHMDTSPYHVLYSSDAHRLDAIFERDSFIELPERSVAAFLSWADSKKG